MSHKSTVEHILPSSNTWVECKSKTHPGNTYYFNTTTGEAVWALTESEIAKSRKVGKKFRQTEGCPEPKGPPMDPSEYWKNQNASSSRWPPPAMYNDQIMNYQFKQPYPPFKQYVEASFNQLVPMFPVNQITPLYSLGNQLYNSSVWPVSPTRPFANQAQNSYMSQNNYQNSVLTSNTAISQPIYSRFNSMGQTPQDSQQNQIFDNNCSYTLKPNQNYILNKKNINVKQIKGFKTGIRDLRQVLSEKRRLKEKNVENCQEYKPEYTNDQLSRPTPRQGAEHREESYQDDANWLEEHMNVQGTQLTLDVTNLKNLANVGTHLDRWYIVADKDIYLNHLNFLNILYNSDERCHLMMPRAVLSDLRAVVASGVDSPRLVSRARRAIALFAQLLDAGMAVVGEDWAESENNCVLNCCQNLVDRSYHVVVISNDSTLQQMANDTSFPILTMNEVKKVLSRPQKNDNKKSDALLLPINITINNDMRYDNEAEKVHKVDECVQIDSEEFVSQSSLFSIEMETNTKNKLKTKYTSEACIQTETNFVDSSGFGSFQDHYEVNKDKTDITWEPHNSDNALIIETRQCDSKNKRKIRPRCQTWANNTVGKKQYEWQRKQTSVKSDQVGSSTGTDEINATEVQFKNLNIGTKNVDVEATEPNGSSRNVVEENIESSGTSSVRNRRVTSDRNNVIFEETSTSGVISNISVDTEVGKPHRSLVFRRHSHNSIKSRDDFPRQESNKSSEGFRFKVTDQNMENELKTRRDEWVFRFVQIMEEVLTQVLQRDPAFCDESMPPPWTLHEAAECIEMKFNNNHEVVEVANKFTDVLSRISHSEGRINMDLTPTQFMELYSYGVQLVKVLQLMFDDCEDLETASGLLSALLSDIRNPMDNNNDAFGDNPHDVSEDNTNISVPPVTPNEDTTAATPSEDTSKHETTPTQINDGNTFKSPSSPKHILSRKPSQDSSSFQSSDSKPDFISNSPHIGYRNFDSQSLLMSSPSATGNQSMDKCSPKIIRNFKIDPEFEKKMQSNPSPLTTDAMDDILDHVDFDDADLEDYGVSGNDSSENENTQIKDVVPDNGCANTITSDERGKMDFNYIVQLVGVTLLDVFTFCEMSHCELRNRMISKLRVQQIREKAKECGLKILDLCNSLERILNRNSRELDKLQYLPDRDAIKWCDNQAKVILKCLNEIVANTT